MISRQRLLLSLILSLPLFLVIFRGSASAQEEVDPEIIQQGAELYASNCAFCHGANGEGRIGATLAKDWPSIQPDARIKNTIINGVPGSKMPAWAESMGGPLTEEQIDAIVTYILTWQTGGLVVQTPFPTATVRPPITPPPNVAGDPNLGAVLFDQNCAACHGENGQGRIGATLAKDWPSIRPDLRLQSTIENGVEGSVMPAWGTAQGGPLNQEEISNLVAYILTWEGVVQSAPTSTPTPIPLGSTGGVLALVCTVLIFLGLVGGILLFQKRRA